MNQREAFEDWFEKTYVNHDYGYSKIDMYSAWQAAQQAQWQPIETAPRDGSCVIGASKLHDEWRIEEVWYCRDYGFGGGQYGDPEFWMPLPPEPKP